MQFSITRFRRYARDLSAAIYELNDEVRMGLPEVKDRLAHIRGINHLTVEQTGRGDEIYRLGEIVAVVPRGNDRQTMIYLEDKFSHPIKAIEVVANPMSTKLQGLAAKISKFRHDAEFEAEKLDLKIEGASGRIPDVFSGAHGAIDGITKQVDDVAAILTEIQKATNGGA